MMNLEQISDQLEIQNLLVAYCHAIDLDKWDALDDVFTPDAEIDYTECGGPKGSYPEIKSFLSNSLPSLPYRQHIVSTSLLKIAGDAATGRTICTNPMGLRLANGDIQHVVFALWYRDAFIRTEAGWRISSRYEELSHVENMPADYPAVSTASDSMILG